MFHNATVYCEFMPSEAYSERLGVLSERFGKLEDIRAELGLSRRQICAQLFVDPSAWSRWTAGGQDHAPERVYKSLALLLEQKRAAQSSATNAATRAESVSLGWKLLLILNTIAIFYLLFMH